MDYEKKYKEALELARKLYNMRGDWTNLEIESIFPELRKSEDEKIRKFLIQMAQNGHGEDKDWWNKCVAWLEKQGEQKPAEWTAEDKNKVSTLKTIVYDDCNAEDASRLITWLNDIKDRVMPQPKQEWSEEDKAILEKCIGAVKVSCYSYSFKSEAENWLKSLRPQNWTKEDKERYISCLQRLSTGNPEQPETINSKWFKEHVYPQNRWRPSDEQLDSLYDVLNPCDGFNREVLESLYVQLKKLKG